MTSWSLFDNTCFYSTSLRYDCRPLITLLVGLALVRYIILYHWFGMGYLPNRGTVAFSFYFVLVCLGLLAWYDLEPTRKQASNARSGSLLCIYIYLLIGLR